MKTIPIAIVVAGIIIAGAIYFSSKNNPPSPKTDEDVAKSIETTDLAINQITTKDYIRGNPEAKIVLVEYSDTECPFCKVFHGTMKSLMDKFGKDGTLAWVYRNFPLEQLHPEASKQAEALLCAGKIGGSETFWSYTDRLYAVTKSNNGLDSSKLPVIAQEVGLNVTDFNACLSSNEMAPIVAMDHADAVKSGGNGTPYSVLIVKKSFNQKEVENFFLSSSLKYKFPPNLFSISKDNKRVSVSGAMPQEFMEQLITLLAR